MDEHHDILNTKDRTHCWLEIVHPTDINIIDDYYLYTPLFCREHYCTTGEMHSYVIEYIHPRMTKMKRYKLVIFMDIVVKLPLNKDFKINYDFNTYINT